jgi:hypothetical protein
MLFCSVSQYKPVQLQSEHTDCATSQILPRPMLHLGTGLYQTLWNFCFVLCVASWILLSTTSPDIATEFHFVTSVWHKTCWYLATSVEMDQTLKPLVASNFGLLVLSESGLKGSVGHSRWFLGAKWLLV